MRKLVSAAVLLSFAAVAVPASADTIDIPQTRQMRRHGGK